MLSSQSCRIGVIRYGTRTLSGFPFSNILNVTNLESNRRRIFRDVYLHRLLQEYFTSMDYNRGPSFLRRCLGSLDHVVEGKSRMVMFGARPWFRFAVIDDNLFPVAEASEIGRHQSGRFQASDLLAQCRNRQRSDSYADDENRRAGSIFSIECLPRCSW
jgi:hypothetical protein